MQGLAKFLEDGGTLMYVNLVVSMITLAIIIDRAIFFLGKGSVNAKAFLEQIRKLVLANNIDRAVKLCSATEAPVAQVARAGLQRVHRGEIAIAQSIEETLVDVTPLLKKRVQILWSIANIATLVGLLGTVIGLIRAFGAVAAAKPEERSALLARGISEALNNTAMGLGIAVTCIIAHAFLSSASKKQVGDLEGIRAQAREPAGRVGPGRQGLTERPNATMTRSQVRAATAACATMSRRSRKRLASSTSSPTWTSSPTSSSSCSLRSLIRSRSATSTSRRRRSSGGGGADTDTPPPEKPPLNLTITVGATGYIVGASGGVLPNIPKLPNGQYDYKTLTTKLKEIKTNPDNAEETKATFNADANIPYDIVIATLDAMRQAEDGKILFPDVNFAAGIQ